MSAPLIWIVLPLLLAVVLFVLRDNQRLVIGLGTGICLFLVGLAFLLPIGEPLQIGSYSLKIGSTFSILGRKLVISATDRMVLVLIYSISAFWFGGAYLSKTPVLFVPIGLAMVSFLVAALAVDPFLYAALLIEIAILISLPILTQQGYPASRGVMRYLIFQTLAMPFILFTGWMLTGVEVGSFDLQLIARAALLLGFGFAFLLAIFPFNSWIPLLVEDAHPYVAGFVFLLLPTVALLFGLKFIDRYAWLRDSENLYLILNLSGVLMVVTGGIWAAFQSNLARLFGYGVIMEMGFSLLAISLGTPAGLNIFANLFLPRVISLATWALGMSIIRQNVVSLRFESLQGIARDLPLATGGVVFAQLSLAGLPLLAGFPTRQALWGGLAQNSPTAGLWVFIGSIGFLLGVIRSLLVYTSAIDKPERKINETGLQRLFIIVGLLGLILVGLFPQVFSSMMNDIVEGYIHLID